MRLTLLPYFGEAHTIKLKCCLHGKWDSPCCHILVRLRLSRWIAVCIPNETHLVKLRIIAAQWCAQCFSFVQLALHLSSRTPRCCLFLFGLGGGGGLAVVLLQQHAQLNSSMELPPVCIITFIVRSWNAGVILLEIDNLWLDSLFVLVM